MAGPVTITCPGCREVFALPAQVVRILGHTVLVRLDRSQAYGHMATCSAMAEPGSPAPEGSKAVAVPEPSVPKADLAGRINQLLTSGAFMSTAGSGACTMCGVNRDACLELVKANGPTGGHPVGAACCNACRDGNTHPAPGESWTCQQWAAEHGAPN